MTQQPTQAPLVAEARLQEIEAFLNHANRGGYANRPRTAHEHVELLVAEVRRLASQLEQANERIEWFERHSDISAAELEQAEREKERLVNALEDAWERFDGIFSSRDPERMTQDAYFGRGEVERAMGSEQNTKPSGEVGEEA